MEDQVPQLQSESILATWLLTSNDDRFQQGKKKIKAVTRALRNVQQTPKFGGRIGPSGDSPISTRSTFTNYDFNTLRRPTSDTEPLRNAQAPGRSPTPTPMHQQSTDRTADSPESLSPNEDAPASQDKTRPEGLGRTQSKTTFLHSPPIRIPETQPLATAPGDTATFRQGVTRYGSIIGSPPQTENPPKPPSLQLPDPAMSNSDTRSRRPQGSWSIAGPPNVVAGPNPSDSTDAYHVGQTHFPHRHFSLPRHMFRARRTRSTPGGNATTSRPLVKRLFSTAAAQSPSIPDVPLSAYRELDAKQQEFFDFLNKELDKIESFYKMKEQEASNRLHILREQLHEMRDRRMQEMMAAKRTENDNHEGLLAHLLPANEPLENGNGHKKNFLRPIEGAIYKTSYGHIGKTSKAMGKLGSPVHPQPRVPEDQKDYVRRETNNEHVPYRTAKRKLKLALQEFYRGLELLKSYSLLNRTAFRKINKKYDKAVNARPTGRYMSEKVNKAWFMQSDIVEGHIVTVEDLYARYFERGNHKIAVTKLRKGSRRSGDFSGNMFRNGFLLAGGLTFGIQGIVYGASYLNSPDATIRLQTSYLLQLHAGYFLSLLLFLIFVFCCRVWSRAKVNYVFIFEYDTRDVLDWRQMAELPCLFFFLNGLFLWLNFRTGTRDSMFLYWPVVLIVITLFIMVLPAPILYHKARKWWGFSNWRLLLAGLYPVEFRDFFLGDMYCSETYAMGNIELFFCLYAQDWSSPTQCNSNHSRLLGFFSTLPGIWRALQCLRRYYDSRNWFPHLANCGKYLGNILYYMSLSLYRLNKTSELRAVFIVFAAINAIYCSLWDVAMDWSLGNPYAKHPFLRDNLAYRRIWPYYLAMILDPILRFQWVFYALFAHDLQHSAVLSFFVALAEVLRRGMWSIFRVENEHCNNVGRFRASRDIPLPYSLPPSPKDSQEEQRPAADIAAVASPATGADVEQALQTPGSSLRLRRTRTPLPTTPLDRAMRRAGTIIGTAHAQDYERKKRPYVVGDSPGSTGMVKGGDDSDEEDEDSDGQASFDRTEEEDEVMEVQKVLSRGKAS